MQWSRPATQHRNLDYSPNYFTTAIREMCLVTYPFRLFISCYSLRRSPSHLVPVCGTTSHTHILQRPFSEHRSFADKFSDNLEFFSPFTCSLLAARVFWFKLRHEPHRTREPPGYLPTSDCSPSNSTFMRTRSGRLHTNELSLHTEPILTVDRKL